MLINGKSICNLLKKNRKKSIPCEKSSGVFLSVFLTSSHGIYLFIFLKGYRINKSCNINFSCCCVIQGTLGICCKEKTDTDLIQWHLQNQAHRSENITLYQFGMNVVAMSSHSRFYFSFNLKWRTGQAFSLNILNLYCCSLLLLSFGEAISLDFEPH